MIPKEPESATAAALDISSDVSTAVAPLVTAWQAAFAYQGDELVCWKRRLWRARWWTQGEEPGQQDDLDSEGVWVDEGAY